MSYSPSTINPSTDTRFTGAVYTPSSVAEALVQRCEAYVTGESISILEPSVGDGVFLTPLLKNGGRNLRVTGIDINQNVVECLKHTYKSFAPNVSFLCQDFLEFSLQEKRANAEKYDVIIGNPPFIRKHNFSDAIKEVLEDFANEFGYEKRDIKNTWAAFVVAACNLLKEGGVAAFVLPYELLTVSYGQRVLKLIADQFERVEIYISDEKAFTEIDQDAVILVAEKTSKSPGGVYLSKVQGFASLEASSSCKVNFSSSSLNGLELNSYLLTSSSKKLISRLSKEASPLSKFANSAPGIVTAANDFFIRSREDVKSLGLSKYAMPILRKGSFASSSPVFRRSDFELLQEIQPTEFLRFTGGFDELTPKAQEYVKFGEQQDLHKRYKCRNRENWHEVPLVEAKSGIFFKRSHSHPRLLVNEAKVLTTDTAYGVTMKDGYSIQGLCISFYNSLTLLFAEMNGRFYGGGVLELSPTEFRGLPIFFHEPSDKEYQEFLSVHENPDNGIEEMLDFGDSLLSTKLALSHDKMLEIRKAWRAVRHHRLRHGGHAKAEKKA